MSASRSLAACCLVALLAPLAAVRAQQSAPHLGCVYPAGGQQGTTFQVKIGGQFLDGVRNVHVSGTGVQASLVEQIKPLTMKQANDLKEKLRELMKKKPRDAQTQKEIADINKRLATYQRRPATPAIAETAIVQVTVAPDAELGQRELRLEAARGLSNPLVFCIGQLPELREKQLQSGEEPPSSKPAKDSRGSQGGQEATGKPSDTAMQITLPAIINGQITPDEGRRQGPRQGQSFTPGDVDRYRFEARKGQQLVVAASARQLIPYLADAVPGWFQATLALYDAAGKEVAYDDDYRFHPDPVLFCGIPEDGQYTIEIKDALYRGRGDFVYRIAVGELPFVTGTFPLGGPAGKQTTVALRGWTLPVEKLTMDAKDKGPGIYPLCVRKGDLVSNYVPFTVDTLPECVEQEANDSPQKAQPVTLPVIVNGRIDRPDDWDVFRFQGRAGEQIVAEVSARRLDSPLDSVLKLTDAAGKQLAFNDDHEDKGDGLNTHHADSLLSVTLPANGTYDLHLGDAQQRGGPEYAYRLRISPPRPDFALRITPSSINARGGTNVPITVYALRKDGFAGEIALSLKGAPEGFRLSGALVPANQDQVRLTLVASAASTEVLPLCVEGRATIAGQQAVRAAVPAEDMMQAFAYRHLVPAQELQVAVAGGLRPRGSAGKAGKSAKFAPGRGASADGIQILGQLPLKIPAGGTSQVQIALPAGYLGRGQIQLELSDPPEGIAIEKVSQAAEGIAVVFHSDAEKAKPGLKGNLIANAFVKSTVTPKTGQKPTERRTLLGTLPAIPFEIVKP